jgi:dTMP kinase
LLTREPGGTATGERIRELVLDPAAVGLSARTEVLLMLAARAQHVTEVIGPALSGGQDVVCDRFSASTVAYQGYGRGLDPGDLARLSEWATDGLQPDRVVLLRVDQETARARMADRGGRDRLEVEEAAFFTRVEQGFDALAASDPVRWRVVDGSGQIDEVAASVLLASGFSL